MVIPDWSASPRPPQSEVTAVSASLKLARPLDRLAAVIIDVCVLLTPLFVLISAPIKRQLTIDFILDSEPHVFIAIVLMVFIAAAILVLYQALMHYKFGQTLGQRVLGVRVVPLFGGERLSFERCLIRACAWVFELLCLGIPWLSLFNDPRRRSWHDRLSDTMVVATSRYSAAAPTRQERLYARSGFAIVLAMFAVTSVHLVSGLFESLRFEHAFMALADKNVSECEVVSQNTSDSAQGEALPGFGDHGRPHERLELAMTLYAAGLADRPCLEAEIERERALRVPLSALTYLAQAFVYADEAEVSNSYLDRVCEDAPGTAACAMSQLVSRWSEENWPAVEQILTSAPKSEGYLEVWGVRHFMKQAAYGRALSVLDQLATHRELSQFSLVQRVKGLYNSYREQDADIAFKQALVALPKEESEDMSAWVCAQQLQKNCHALQSPACLSRGPSNREQIDFTNPPAALADLLALECKSGDTPVDYARLSDETNDPIWQNFLKGMHKRQRDDATAAAPLFARVVGNDETPELLRVEAVRRWSQFASKKELAQIVSLWNDFDSRETWAKAGNWLVPRLADGADPKLALKVARHLMNGEALSPQSLALLAKVLPTTDASNVRAPASTGVRDHVRRALDALEEDN